MMSNPDPDKISPCIWFNDNAEEAVKFYMSLFPDSKITNIKYCDEGEHKPAGSVTAIAFKLNGRKYIALNGGPEFPLTPAISLCVTCDSQEELDAFWGKFLEGGGKEGQCGWLTDKFGLSWQIIPSTLERMLHDEDGEKSGRVMRALMKMVKIDTAALEEAFNGVAEDSK